MNTVTIERSTRDKKTSGVNAIPDVEITDALQQQIDKIAADYAQGQYSDMDDYTVNLDRHATGMKLSYSQFVTELSRSLERMRQEKQFDETSVVALLLKR